MTEQTPDVRKALFEAAWEGKDAALTHRGYLVTHQATGDPAFIVDDEYPFFYQSNPSSILVALRGVIELIDIIAQQ